MNAEVDMRIDRHIGDFFVQRLKDTKQRLWVMSPWIAAEYADLLLQKKNAGVDVRLITTNDYSMGQKKSLSKLLEPQVKIIKPENKGLEYGGIALFILSILLLSSTKGYSLLFILVGAILYFIGKGKKEKYYISKIGDGNLVIVQFHPYKIVHAKIYVADDTVIMGSANFTQNGLQNSIEGMATIQSAELATRVGEMMANIKNGMGLTIMSYNRIGEDVSYIEPKRRFYRRHYRSARTLDR